MQFIKGELAMEEKFTFKEHVLCYWGWARFMYRGRKCGMERLINMYEVHSMTRYCRSKSWDTTCRCMLVL